MPRAAKASASSRETRAGAEGSWKTAVPTDTAEAPARMNWRASRPVLMPPMPRIGTSGIAACTCHTQRTATGRIAGPDSPPVTPARAGRRVSVSMTMPSSVLIMLSPSAPASTTARAISTMSVTSGDSLASTGMRGSVARRTADTTAEAGSAWQAKTWPRSSTLGHEMLTSIAETPSALRSRWARRWYSSTLPPAIDTTARAPRSRSQARSWSMKASMPGPCSPIELSMPLGVSAIRGVARPDRGRSMIDLVTTAPIAVRSRNGSSSRPAAAHPDAVSTGSGSSSDPSDVLRSTAGGAADPLRAGTTVMRVISALLPARGAPTQSAGTVPMSAQRTRSPRNTGPSVQERTIRVSPSSPTTGSTQVMHTPMPQAIDSSTAHWLCAPAASAISVTACSMPIGPHA